MNNNCISVIVPVYKVESYIRQCINSILNQTYSHFELILVDDGSPDNCGYICDEYAERDSRVKVIHQENAGLSAARNAGLKIMSGEYVTFIDSDDIVDKDYLLVLFKAIKNYGAQIVISDYLRFVEEKELNNSINSINTVNVMSGKDAVRNIYIRDKSIKYIISCAKLYEASLFKNVNFPFGKQHEDEYTTYKLLYKANIVVELYCKLYFYRVNFNSIMNKEFSLKRYDAINALKEREQFFNNNKEPELAKATRENIKLSLSKNYILAKNAGIQNELPREYKRNEFIALITIHKLVTNDNFEFYLSINHPKLVIIHSYLHKIKKIFHIPCK